MLAAMGASTEERCIVADGLITASCWWHPGQHQGLEKLFRYARRVGNGGIVPGVAMEYVRDNAATALLDAAKGFGYVAGQRAMSGAVQKAKKSLAFFHSAILTSLLCHIHQDLFSYL